MTNALARFGAVNPAALAVSALLLVGLLIEGANNAAAAALLSLTLAAALLSAAALVPRRTLVLALRAHWLAIAAAALFLGYALSTTLPAALFGQPPHPIWNEAANAPLSLSPYRTLEGVIAFIGPCAAFLLGALLCQDREGRAWSARWIIVAGAAYAIAGFLLFFAGRSGPRLDVGVSSANVAAAVFAAFSLVAIASIARAWRGADATTSSHRLQGALALFNAPFSLGVLLILFAALLLTASRGGLVCAIVGVLVILALMLGRRIKSTGWRAGALGLPALVIAAALVLLFARGGEEVLARFSLAQDDWLQRQALIDAHWPYVLERPWLGHGLNTYHELNSQALDPNNWRGLAAAGSAHNIYVQALEETGAIGLALLALSIAAPIAMAMMRAIGAKPGAEWAAAAVAISVVFLTHGLVDFALQTPAVAVLYAFILGAWSTPIAR